MKILIYFLLLFFIPTASSAQVQKRFINRKGGFTKDSVKAIAYVLSQRLSDSSWLAAKYDKDGNLLLKATYLDEDLNFIHGRATYYNVRIVHQIVANKGEYIDTVNHIEETGFYLNGKKYGIWLTYLENSQPIYSKTFEADTLNGTYKIFYDNGKLEMQGEYVKGFKEGDWVTYYPDSSVHIYDKFFHGRLVKDIIHQPHDKMYIAEAGFNFNQYLLRKLKKANYPAIKGFVAVSFLVSVDGYLSNVKVDTDNLDLKKVLTEAYSQSPKWLAATLNDKPIEQRVSLIIYYKNSQQSNFSLESRYHY